MRGERRPHRCISPICRGIRALKKSVGDDLIYLKLIVSGGWNECYLLSQRSRRGMEKRTRPRGQMGEAWKGLSGGNTGADGAGSGPGASSICPSLTKVFTQACKDCKDFRIASFRKETGVGPAHCTRGRGCDRTGVKTPQARPKQKW